MKRNPMSVVSVVNARKMLFAIFCCVLLVLFTAPAWADQCSGALATTTISMVATSGISVTLTVSSPAGLFVGQTITPSGFTSATFLNGVTITISNIYGTTVTGTASFVAPMNPYGPVSDSGSFTQVGNATGCGVLITIKGTSGNLTATIKGGGIANGNPYDGDEDQLIGIQNSTETVTIGAIRLSSPPVNEYSVFPYTSNLFAFDGDGPCDFLATGADCYNDGAPAPEDTTSEPDPLDYEGPNNIFVGISPDFTTGTVLFLNPIQPGGSTWFGLENTPTTAVAFGETQPLALGVTNVFPFGPVTCPSDECTYGSGVWTETHTLDDVQFTPVSQLTSTEVNPDLWTVLPVPVCAGPLGESPFGPFTVMSPPPPSFGFITGNFGTETPSNCLSYGPPGFVTNFGPTSATTFGSLPYPNANSLAIVPYSDYSSKYDPVGIEIERDCIGPDCTGLPLQNLQWTMQLDYDIDPYSIAGPIGGPVICFAPGVPAPTTPTLASEDPFNKQIIDCSVNAITSYTGAIPGEDPPPPKGGGTDGKSVFASLFSPAQSETAPIPQGVTVGFPGFEAIPILGPTSNTNSPSCSPEPATYLLFPSGKQVSTPPLEIPVNCVFKGVPWLLAWDDTTISGTPITNLQLCLTVGINGSCTSPAIAAGTLPWVHLSLVPVSGCPGFVGQNPLAGVGPNHGFANLDLLPLTPLPGQYEFSWEPVSNPKGCTVAVVVQFSNGTFASTEFVYSN